MIRLAFSLDWICQNDIDTDPQTVKITFPQSWIKAPPPISNESQLVTLNIPTQLLFDHNKSKDTKEITVSFPNYYFDGLPSSEITSVPSDIEPDRDDNATDAIEYAERMWYNHNAGDYITGARGRVVPTYHYNEGEDFIVYQEIEFYGYGGGDDAIEIISDIRPNVDDTKVWVAVWRDGTWISSFNLGLLADIGDEIHYEFYTRSYSGYICWLQDTEGYWYNGTCADSTLPSDFRYITGSCEIDTVNGLSENFTVCTYPITVEGLETAPSYAWSSSSYVDQRFDFWYQDADAPHVYITSTLTQSGLFFYQTATN
jgi:hypothetical protein